MSTPREKHDLRVRIADRVRRVAVRLGTRRFKVFLTHTRWTGPERYYGEEIVVSSTELEPAPRIEGWNSIALALREEGRAESGIVTAYVSANYSISELLPEVDGQSDFFWEIVDEYGERRRFFPQNSLELEAGSVTRQIQLRLAYGGLDENKQTASVTTWLPPKA